MEQKSAFEKLLHGHATGIGVALRGCPEELEACVTERFAGAAVGRVSLMEPCRTEHPHSAFLRKTTQTHGRQAVQTTLFAPGGKLTEERAADGEVFERFVKKPQDFELLRGFLRDVELYPAKARQAEAATPVASLGLTPIREMETRWAGTELMQWALMTQDEAAASCLRKLERQLHRRAEEAARMGCRAALLADMNALPLPETYMIHAGRHIERMRHAGLLPYVEAASPAMPLLAALHAASAGVRAALVNPALREAAFAPPEGMRFLFDLNVREGLGELTVPEITGIFGKCGSAVVLLDCFEAEEEQIASLVDVFARISAE